MTWSWSRQRRVASKFGEDLLVDRVGAHDFGPLWPLRVLNPDRDRATHRVPVTNSTGDRDVIRLELHPGATADSKPATSELVLHLCGRQRHACRHSLQDSRQCLTMGFPGREPTQHVDNPDRSPAACEFGLHGTAHLCRVRHKARHEPHLVDRLVQQHLVPCDDPASVLKPRHRKLRRPGVVRDV